MNNIITEIIEDLNKEHEKIVLRSASVENEFDEAYLDAAGKALLDAIRIFKKLNSTVNPAELERINGKIAAWKEIEKIVHERSRKNDRKGII